MFLERGENAALALYQLLREAAEQALRRGPPARIEISLRETDSGGVELIVADDGPPERRAAVLEALAERAATLNGRFSSEVRYPRGSTLRVEVPPGQEHAELTFAAIMEAFAPRKALPIALGTKAGHVILNPPPLETFKRGELECLFVIADSDDLLRPEEPASAPPPDPYGTEPELS